MECGLYSNALFCCLFLLFRSEMTRVVLNCLYASLRQFIRTGGRHNVLGLFVRPFVLSLVQSCERVILKTNEPNLLQIGRSGMWGKGMK